MRSRIFLAASAALLFSCSPKTVVQPTTPKTPETPVTTVAEAPAPMSENVMKGKDLYDGRCGKCHPLFKPSDHTAEQWEPILKRMQKKAHISDEDMVLVHDYVFANLSQ